MYQSGGTGLTLLQRVQEGSISWGWGTEHLSTGAVALRSVKTSAVGLGPFYKDAPG